LDLKGFWQLLVAKTVADRMDNAGHKFSSTMHAPASAIKKIQGIAEDGQGTRLLRGLGELITQLLIHLYSSLIIFNRQLEMFLIVLFSSLLLRWAGRSSLW
jgi:hypothetical protein